MKVISFHASSVYVPLCHVSISLTAAPFLLAKKTACFGWRPSHCAEEDTLLSVTCLIKPFRISLAPIILSRLWFLQHLYPAPTPSHI